jgi:hypothetical protein
MEYTFREIQKMGKDFGDGVMILFSLTIVGTDKGYVGINACTIKTKKYH